MNQLTPCVLEVGAEHVVVAERRGLYVERHRHGCGRDDRLLRGEPVGQPGGRADDEQDGSGLGERKLGVLNNSVTLQELVNGINALGIGPRDMITILQAIKAAGALQAEIEVL